MTAIINILLVDDSPEDVDLALEALEGTKIANHVSVVEDGVEALAFLRQQGKYASAPRPALILLDLNMPKKDGREVLEEIKTDPDLKDIPVVILTTSRDEEDVAKAYKAHANCYVQKPVSMAEFVKVVHAIDNFWFAIVELPTPPTTSALRAAIPVTIPTPTAMTTTPAAIPAMTAKVPE
jgi:two-component system, chemotaxis family, response regulator Rcp1